MPKRQRLGWYSFYKASVDTQRAVTHNPLPSKPPVKLQCGALYFDLTPDNFKSPESMPNLPSRLGRLQSDQDVEMMRRLRAVDPEKWTIDTLSKTFHVTRSYVINHVYKPHERAEMELQDQRRFLSLPLNKIKGALLSARIRQIREDSS